MSIQDIILNFDSCLVMVSVEQLNSTQTNYWLPDARIW